MDFLTKSAAPAWKFNREFKKLGEGEMATVDIEDTDVA